MQALRSVSLRLCYGNFIRIFRYCLMRWSIHHICLSLSCIPGKFSWRMGFRNGTTPIIWNNFRLASLWTYHLSLFRDNQREDIFQTENMDLGLFIIYCNHHEETQAKKKFLVSLKHMRHCLLKYRLFYFIKSCDI